MPESDKYRKTSRVSSTRLGKPPIRELSEAYTMNMRTLDSDYKKNHNASDRKKKTKNQ